MAYNQMPKEGYSEAYPHTPEFGWKPPTDTSGAGPAPPPVSMMDPEIQQPKSMLFDDASIRRGFIRKVYLILMGQLAVTCAFVAVFLFNEPLQQYSQRNPMLLLGACITTLVVVLMMACCETARRTYPMNFICLSIFTLAESFLLGAISSKYKSEEVLLAIGITAVLCFALSLFALQTKYDFTMCGGFVLCALVFLLIFAIVAMFWQNQIVKTLYAGCGALLSCFFLIYDTQIMIGGTHKYAISPEEYIFAALNLYMDVIRIFIYILQLIGTKK